MSAALHHIEDVCFETSLQ